MACRAALRGLHEAAQPLTVVFPAAGLVAASGGAQETGSFFVRVYETVTVHLHERAANSFLRAQAIVDTVTAGKMAAAAASAAAVAGGGVAVEGALTSAPERPAALMRRVESTASLGFVKQPARTTSGGKTRSATHAKPRARRRAHAASRGRTTAKPPPRQPQPTSTTSATTAPRATVATTGGTARSASAAAGEFGFEGP
jgi:hypothetical protein